MQIKNIDFNCDLAQSYGVYRNECEFELLDYVSSVNISCGFHAGDPVTTREALLKAKEKGLVIGAHIGFDDISGFGYREMRMPDDELEALIIYQVGALMSYAKIMKMEIEHVRPHGAMYRMASQDFEVAKVIVGAIKKASEWLVYYGAAGEVTQRVADELNMPVAHEVFLEKMYNLDGSIDYAARDNENVDVMIGRLKNLLATSQVSNNVGEKTTLTADTIHFKSKDLLVRSHEVITPLPVNYKNATLSGWVQ
jgi:UPF0271 protein